MVRENKFYEVAGTRDVQKYGFIRNLQKDSNKHMTKKKPTPQTISKLHARVNSETPPASASVHEQYRRALQANTPKVSASAKVKRSKKPGESKIVPQ